MEKSLNFMKSSWNLSKWINHGKIIEFWISHSWKNHWILKWRQFWLTAWVNEYEFYIYIIYWYTIHRIKEEDFYQFSYKHPIVDIRCVRRPCVTCGPAFFCFVTLRIFMEIWKFCLEISLKNHWNFSRRVCGNPVSPEPLVKKTHWTTNFRAWLLKWLEYSAWFRRLGDRVPLVGTF